MSLYIASYDIADDRRRTRVARLLLQYGTRIQQSVYELFLDPEELPEFRRELGVLLSVRDHFTLFPVDERGTRATLSWQRELPRHEPVIFL